MAAYSGCGEGDGGIRHGERRSRTGMARVGGDVQLAGGRVSGKQAPSGRKWQGSQSSEGATELGFPGPALGKMQSEAARRVGEPSGEGEEASSEGLGGYQLLPQTDARCPACQVMRHHPVSSTGQALDGQPGAVGGEATRGEMIQPHAVLEVSDGILYLGVAAMVGLQFQGLPLPVGDEAVIAVAGEEGPLGTGRRLHPPDDEPHRRGVRRGLEGGVEPVSQSLLPSFMLRGSDGFGRLSA